MRLWHVAFTPFAPHPRLKLAKKMKFYFHSPVAIGTPDAFLVSESRIIYDTARKQCRRIVVCSVRKKCSLGRARDKFNFQCAHEIVEGFAAVHWSTQSQSQSAGILLVLQTFAPNCPHVRSPGPQQGQKIKGPRYQPRRIGEGMRKPTSIILESPS